MGKKQKTLPAKIRKLKKFIKANEPKPNTKESK